MPPTLAFDLGRYLFGIVPNQSQRRLATAPTDIGRVSFGRPPNWSEFDLLGNLQRVVHSNPKMADKAAARTESSIQTPSQQVGRHAGARTRCIQMPARWRLTFA
jgi:hypothetical protein